MKRLIFAGPAFVLALMLCALPVHSQNQAAPAPQSEPTVNELKAALAQQQQQILDLQKRLVIAERAALGADTAKQFDQAQQQVGQQLQGFQRAVDSEKAKDAKTAKTEPQVKQAISNTK